jgi:hypothetical protein
MQSTFCLAGIHRWPQRTDAITRLQTVSGYHSIASKEHRVKKGVDEPENNNNHTDYRDLC